MLNRDKLISVAKGAGIAAAGAALAYLGNWVAGGDLGEFTGVAAAVLAVVVNYVRKLATDE